MQLIKEIDPDFLSSIDKTSNIIICVPPDDKNLKETEVPDVFSVLLTQDLNLSSAVAINTNILAVDYSPRIKVLTPTGIRLEIRETEYGRLVNIFQKIYTDYTTKLHYNSIEEKILQYRIYEDFSFTLYIDVIQMRKKIPPLLLPKGETIVDLYFSWYVQTKNPIPNIENIYLIKDLYVYQEFAKII